MNQLAKIHQHHWKELNPCSLYSINTQIKREGNENQGHVHQIEIDLNNDL